MDKFHNLKTIPQGVEKDGSQNFDPIKLGRKGHGREASYPPIFMVT